MASHHRRLSALPWAVVSRKGSLISEFRDKGAAKRYAKRLRGMGYPGAYVGPMPKKVRAGGFFPLSEKGNAEMERKYRRRSHRRASFGQRMLRHRKNTRTRTRR